MFLREDLREGALEGAGDLFPLRITPAGQTGAAG